jgi:NAD(P)-dependent dehydrogenase (short-subunit alcohol dehydrogenase family)
MEEYGANFRGQRGDPRGCALIVGASGGVGLAIALRLAEAGYDLALHGRNEARLAAAREAVLARRLRARTRVTGSARAPRCVHVASFAIDVTAPGGPERTVRLARERLGPIGVLVNAAGTFGPLQPLATSDPGEWERTMQVNAIAPYRFARAVLGDMIALGRGRIVNVSSRAAFGPPGPMNSAYATGKVALNRWTAGLACELEGSGVTANAIDPGELRTRMWAEIARAADRIGGSGASFAAWAREVDASRGDDPDAAGLLVRAIVEDPAAPNGMFFTVGGVPPRALTEARGDSPRARVAVGGGVR